MADFCSHSHTQITTSCYYTLVSNKPTRIWIERCLDCSVKLGEGEGSYGN